MQKIDFPLRGDHITLDRLLKATGLAGSGAQAKQLVADGKVQVDGRDELRKTAKLRAGQVISVTGTRIRLLPPAAAETAEAAEGAGATGDASDLAPDRPTPAE
ncbi:RNA-binding S4 domain-containing protein [Aquabacterium humicola]|uniref:RNA-binding S4 domain-containing protein n=1 Tax=Aquabacterium humicola TaxID=3237377 RepID=UPI003F75152D